MTISESNTLRIGVIGAGGRGINCFGKLLAGRDDARLVAVAEPNPARAEGAMRRIRQTFRVYPDARQMLLGEELDGVIVTTPDYLHAETVVTVLEAGIQNVLVDKPLATTVEGCLSIISAMRKTGGRVTVGFNMRHLPFIVKIKELIEDDAIGELMLIENREFYNGGRSYMARWNRRWQWSGGLWVHKGSHDFDVFNWWNAKGTPTRVMASAGMNALREDKIPFAVHDDVPVGPHCRICAYNTVCPDKVPPMGGVDLFNEETSREDGYVQDLCVYLSDKDTHDNGIALVEYDNNVRASHMECFVCNFDDRFYTVVGDRGTLIGNLANASQIELRPRWGENKTISVPIAGDDAHGGSDPRLLDDFLASIREGAAHSESSSATVRDGLRSIAIGQAAEIAWRQGRSVAISELLDLTREE